MANNNENPRRDPNRPEDNPFIAFRRFADSQVSSLLNTVFTLPATMANYNNAHQAREQCLFGKADKRQCDQLQSLEEEIAELRRQGRALFSVGDVQAVLRNSEELMRLDRRAEIVRREIVDEAAARNGLRANGPTQADLVERVANEKGQEWGWSWDWGYPRPFDHENRRIQQTPDDDAARQATRSEYMLQLQTEAKKIVGEQDYDEVMAELTKLFANVNSNSGRGNKTGNDASMEIAKHENHRESRADTGEPRVWSWSRSWQWPPPPADSARADNASYSPRLLETDPELKKSGVQWGKAYADLLRAEQDERPHCMRSDNPTALQRRERTRESYDPHQASQRDLEEHDEQKWVPHEDWDVDDEPSYEYGHDHDDEPDDPPTPKIDKRAFPEFNLFKRVQDTTTREATTREELKVDDVLAQQQERKRQLLTLLEREAQEHHGQRETSTELDVYEQLLAATEKEHKQADTSSASKEMRPSVLSTLTTTERSVGPDGSITTKIVLKKRFTDGREESSETVHIQRGQQIDKTSQAASLEQHNNKNERKGGWFWSS